MSKSSGENKRTCQKTREQRSGVHTIGKLVVAGISGCGGVSPEHELDHGVLSHENLGLGALAELGTNHMHLL